jgi:hypothetical protein
LCIPSGSSKHPLMGLARKAAPPSDNPDETVGLH